MMVPKLEMDSITDSCAVRLKDHEDNDDGDNDDGDYDNDDDNCKTTMVVIVNVIVSVF